MEFLDIVDVNGVPTGETAERGEVHLKGLRHRTSHVWVVRKREGRTEVLLQKRSPMKESHPGVYDISSAGHIPAGCSYEESAVREIWEELGLTISEQDLHYIGVIKKHNEAVFFGKPYIDEQVSNVYWVCCDKEAEEFQIQEEELESVMWIDLDECIERVEKGTIKHCLYMDELKMLKEI